MLTSDRFFNKLFFVFIKGYEFQNMVLVFFYNRRIRAYNSCLKGLN